MPLTDTQKARIKKTFANFLDKRAKNLEKLTLDDLKFNVVALRTTAPMLDFGSAEDLLRYRLAQHLERGTTTAMGSALQAIAKEISGSGSGVAGADIEVIDSNGRRNFVQIKSGPDTANKDIAQNIGTLLNSARARDPSAICVLGVCYGRPDQISPIAKKELQNRGVGMKIGRDFWEFISGDPKCLAEVMEIAAEAAKGSAGGDLTFAERVEKKLDDLVSEFESRYGKKLEKAWDNFLADNS
jgi:Type II restriction endonuclease EcoO109I